MNSKERHQLLSCWHTAVGCWKYIRLRYTLDRCHNKLRCTSCLAGNKNRQYINQENSSCRCLGKELFRQYSQEHLRSRRIEWLRCRHRFRSKQFWCRCRFLNMDHKYLLYMDYCHKFHQCIAGCQYNKRRCKFCWHRNRYRQHTNQMRNSDLYPGKGLFRQNNRSQHLGWLRCRPGLLFRRKQF